MDETESLVTGAFELDHLQSVKPILFWQFAISPAPTSHALPSGSGPLLRIEYL